MVGLLASVEVKNSKGNRAKSIFMAQSMQGSESRSRDKRAETKFSLLTAEACEVDISTVAQI